MCLTSFFAGCTHQADPERGGQGLPHLLDRQGPRSVCSDSSRHRTRSVPKREWSSSVRGHHPEGVQGGGHEQRHDHGGSPRDEQHGAHGQVRKSLCLYGKDIPSRRCLLSKRLVSEATCEIRGIPFIDNGPRDRRKRRMEDAGRGGRIPKKRRDS